MANSICHSRKWLEPPADASAVQSNVRPSKTHRQNSSPSVPNGINDTPFHRFALMAAIKTLRPFCHIERGVVLFLTNKLCVKYGNFVQLSEAFTLQYIASHTSIPVPKIYCAFVHKECTYILMEKIRGKTLAHGWHARPAHSKENIFSQLRTMVNEMRALPAPSPAIANALGGPLYDDRSFGQTTIGPFADMHDFHLFLRKDLPSDDDNFPGPHDMMRLQDQPWPMPVFTHGDLSCFNILARGDRVVGIVDWETAGWFPSYWEYSMAWWFSNPYNEYWRDQTDNFLDPLMPQELEVMERTRLKYFGI